MAKKSTTTDKKVFSFTTESPLVKQTEAAVVQGYQAIEEKEQGVGVQPKTQQSVAITTSGTKQNATQEQTKGVQAYIPMSMYRKLNNLKYERGETIGNLLVQAIAFWLEKQDV